MGDVEVLVFVVGEGEEEKEEEEEEEEDVVVDSVGECDDASEHDSPSKVAFAAAMAACSFSSLRQASAADTATFLRSLPL